MVATKEQEAQRRGLLSHVPPGRQSDKHYHTVPLFLVGRPTLTGTFPMLWAASVWDKIPRLRQASAISLMGCKDPTWPAESKTARPKSNSATEYRPSAVGSRTLHTQKKKGVFKDTLKVRHEKKPILITPWATEVLANIWRSS